MDDETLFSRHCSFADVARLQAALELFAPGSALSYTIDDRGVRLTRVLIPVNGGHDVCLTRKTMHGEWEPTYQKDGKDLCKMRMVGVDYTNLIEAIRGAFATKNMLWV